MANLEELAKKHSRSSVVALSEIEIQEQVSELEGWELQDGFLVREFTFKNYYQTLAFVNAIACVAHSEDHHPELVVTYNRCVVKFNTHSVKGVSENDFICAAKLNAHIAVFLPKSSLKSEKVAH